MSGAFLRELWKYHERVRSNLTSDLEEFKKSNALAILGDLKCNNPIGSGGPFWLDSYISNIGMGPVAAALDFTDFHMGLTKHITYWSSNVTKTRSGCAACSGVPRKKLCELWEALTTTVHCGIAKVSAIYVAASPNESEHLYRLRQILRSLLRRWGREVRPDRFAKPHLHRNIRICSMQISFSSHPTLSISASTNQRWLRHRRFLLTCPLSPSNQATQQPTTRPTSSLWCMYPRMPKS